MNHPTLYLMLGYPGAGKTTTARIIHQLTGAVHLWADKIRNERFPSPTHSHTENIALYKYLNKLAAELLATGQDVIFDTNFNFYKDRQKLRAIATEHGAQTRLVWVTTPRDLACRRATQASEGKDTRVFGNMPLASFERMSNNLEEPLPDEQPLTLDGTNVTLESIQQLIL